MTSDIASWAYTLRYSYRTRGYGEAGCVNALTTGTLTDSNQRIQWPICNEAERETTIGQVNQSLPTIMLHKLQMPFH